jgi:6-phosphogluconolactonase
MQLTVLDSAEDVAMAAAERFVTQVNTSIRERGRFAAVLSGGSTPKKTYELLATPDFRDRVRWTSVHLFFGDERTVPPDHPDSNYRMAYNAFISHVPIPTENVHRMKGEMEPVSSARKYEAELRAFFPNLAWPAFDLVFLGLGDDGHTASLFPDTEALYEQTAWVVSNWVEKLKTVRLTLTIPALNHASQILFLVTGTAKAPVIRALIEGAKVPTALIAPVEGDCEWVVDKTAASLIKS